MSKKLTNEDIDNRLEGRPIKRVGEYVNNRTKLDWQCLACDHTWPARFTGISDGGSGCPECAKGPRHTTRLTSNEADARLNRVGVSLDDVYILSNAKVWARCNSCGHRWRAVFNSIASGKSPCQICHEAHTTPDSIYIGIIQTADGYYFKPGITARDSMQSRYATDSKIRVGKPISIDQLRFYTQKESCIDLERDLIAFCKRILGEPVAGHEWFRLPDEDELDEILIYFKKITQRK